MLEALCVALLHPPAESRNLGVVFDQDSFFTSYIHAQLISRNASFYVHPASERCRKISPCICFLLLDYCTALLSDSPNKSPKTPQLIHTLLHMY